MPSLSEILSRAVLSPQAKAESDIRAADEWMRQLASGDIYALDAATQNNLAHNGNTALANRFIFACLDDNPGEEREVWVFMPVAQWAATSQLYALTGPIEALLPAGAMEIAEGTWMWDDQKSKYDRALSLMGHGFIWDPSFQMRVDKSQTALIKAITNLSKSISPAP